MTTFINHLYWVVIIAASPVAVLVLWRAMREPVGK
jgi:hypothetical protein